MKGRTKMKTMMKVIVHEQIINALWGVKDVAAFVAKSERWVRYALVIPPTKAGSIPHFRVGESPRFDPDEIRGWARAGCPPVSEFRRAKNNNRKLQRRVGPT